MYILDRIARQTRASGDPEDPARDPTGPQDDPQEPVSGGGTPSIRSFVCRNAGYPEEPVGPIY